MGPTSLLLEPNLTHREIFSIENCSVREQDT